MELLPLFSSFSQALFTLWYENIYKALIHLKKIESTWKNYRRFKKLDWRSNSQAVFFTLDTQRYHFSCLNSSTGAHLVQICCKFVQVLVMATVMFFKKCLNSLQVLKMFHNVNNFKTQVRGDIYKEWAKVGSQLWVHKTKFIPVLFITYDYLLVLWL